MAGVGAYRRELSCREFDPLAWRGGQIQKRPTSQTVQPRSLHARRHPAQLDFLATELPRFEASGA
jgi:hypothetical protein